MNYILGFKQSGKLCMKEVQRSYYYLEVQNFRSLVKFCCGSRYISTSTKLSALGHIWSTLAISIAYERKLIGYNDGFRDPGALAYAIKRSCENKATVVSLDEKESGLRATLNLGHTFGHVSFEYMQLTIFLFFSTNLLVDFM